MSVCSVVWDGWCCVVVLPLSVSNGWPTMTRPTPPAVPASISLTARRSGEEVDGAAEVEGPEGGGSSGDVDLMDMVPLPREGVGYLLISVRGG